MSSIGHMIGYAAGSIDLLQILGTTLGDSQFQQLTIIAAIAILGSTAVTCWAVTEKVLVMPKGAEQSKSIVQVLRQILSTVRHLPDRKSVV